VSLVLFWLKRVSSLVKYVCLVSVVVSKRSSVEGVQDVFLMSQMDGRPYGRFVSSWSEGICPGAEWSVIGQLGEKTSVSFNWTTDGVSSDESQRSNVTFR
jgi:hypothetical protein